MTAKECLALAAAGVDLKTLATIVAAFEETPKTQNQSHASETHDQESKTPTWNQPPSTHSGTDVFGEIMGALKELKSSVNQANVNNSQQPEAPSVDDYLASIINPGGGN